MSDDDRKRWDQRYAERADPGEPSAWLVSIGGHLPERGRALDLAGGAGRNALWLTKRGLEVTLVDVSPVALAIAQRAARSAGLSLRTFVWDAERDPFPPGPWDLIVSHHFLHRPLFATFASMLAPGGVLAFDQPTRRNLERNPHPSARFLLDDGELPTLVRGLEIVRYDEGWTEEGRHEARLIARAPT